MKCFFITVIVAVRWVSYCGQYVIYPIGDKRLGEEKAIRKRYHNLGRDQFLEYSIRKVHLQGKICEYGKMCNIPYLLCIYFTPI